MKKADLEKAIRNLAKAQGKDMIYAGGGRHDKFLVGGATIVIPRHREIDEMTARVILKQAHKAHGL